MATVNLSPLDIKDLLELLDYAAEKKEDERGLYTNKNNHWDDTNWYLIRIDQLKRVLNGKNNDIIARSSLPVNDYETPDEEKNRNYYMRTKGDKNGL